MAAGWLAKFREPKRKRTKQKSKRIPKKKIVHVVMMPPDINAPPVGLSTTRLGSQSVDGRVLQSPASVISLPAADPNDMRVWNAAGVRGVTPLSASAGFRRSMFQPHSGSPSSSQSRATPPPSLSRVSGAVPAFAIGPLSASHEVRLNPAGQLDSHRMSPSPQRGTQMLPPLILPAGRGADIGAAGPVVPRGGGRETRSRSRTQRGLEGQLEATVPG